MPNLMKAHLIREYSFDERTFHWGEGFSSVGMCPTATIATLMEKEGQGPQKAAGLKCPL